jgi:hypothetical protein
MPLLETQGRNTRLLEYLCAFEIAKEDEVTMQYFGKNDRNWGGGRSVRETGIG